GWTMELAKIKDPVEAYETMTRVAQTADEVGFASAWLVDHFHTTPYPSQEVTFECWVSTAALARDTRSIRIGQMVTCNSYRHPALLAKMASTGDGLSHGRLTFGIGAGWYEHEYHAYGYAYPDALKERLRQRPRAISQMLELGSLAMQQPDVALQLADRVVGENLTLAAIRTLIRGYVRPERNVRSDREQLHNRRGAATSMQKSQTIPPLLLWCAILVTRLRASQSRQVILS